MAQKRRIEISALNVLFCLSVIFIHIISYAVTACTPGTIEYNLAMIPWRLSSYVVQGFVMLAGVKLFLNKKEDKPYLLHLRARVKGVIVPYAVSFLVYYIYFVIVYKYTFDVMFILRHFLLGSLVFHLYFIPMLFQFDLLFPVWKKIVNKCSPVIIIPFALLFSQLCESHLPQMISAVFPNVSFIYNDRIFTTYLAYWLIGCYIGKYYDSFCEILKKNFRTICIIFVIVLLMVIYFSYLAYNNITSVPYMNMIHNLYVLYVCVFLYAVALKIPPKVYERIPLVTKIDKWSLYIYLYHILVIFLAEKLLRFIS